MVVFETNVRASSLKELSNPSLLPLKQVATTAHAQSPAASDGTGWSPIERTQRTVIRCPARLDTLPAGEHFKFRNHLFIKLGTTEPAASVDELTIDSSIRSPDKLPNRS